MTVKRKDQQQKILNALKKGVQTPQDLIERAGLEISQPTLSRIIGSLKDKVVKLGKGRSTTYALPRDVHSIPLPIPLYEVAEDGSTSLIGNLHPIFPSGYYFQSDLWKNKSGFFEDIPYFLQHLRPTGYLGRRVPGRYPELQANKDITLWSDKTCIHYAARFGFDHSGSLILGEEAMSQFMRQKLEQVDVVQDSKKNSTYSAMALQLSEQTVAHSSADGEQPKFICTVAVEGQEAQMIVKHSPIRKSEVAERICDLLVCEHLALETLRKGQNEVPVSVSSLLNTKERVYLESKRFDRLDGGGRKAIIPLAALAAEHVGLELGWSETAFQLCKEKLISIQVYEQIQFAEAYGHLIGNSDMHLHNISLFTEKADAVALAPIYDMLPMAFMPKNDSIKSTLPTVQDPVPKFSKAWKKAYPFALEFWREVQNQKQISEPFKTAAQKFEMQVQGLEKVIRVLPD